jgi:hypothetical protein
MLLIIGVLVFLNGLHDYEVTLVAYFLLTSYFELPKYLII